ncbi:MAG: DUF2075 domain-containing protein [Gammaproteobacteria bacterium]
MKRAFYSAPISVFLSETENAVLGQLVANNTFETNLEQRHSWSTQISLLQRDLNTDSHGTGRILFEFAIPRMGKRVDVVLILGPAVFPIEFKVGEQLYPKYAIRQVEDYGLDLKNFHAYSHDKPIVPVLASTCAESRDNSLESGADSLYATLLANSETLVPLIDRVAAEIQGHPIDACTWENSDYRPTPTIVEAAKALYRGHRVDEISRSDAGAKNLSQTSAAVNRAVEEAKQSQKKTICFITGVPGSGKTLAGLNIATERNNTDAGEHAVFLSGNGPLVAVLREALAVDRVEQAAASDLRVTKAKAKSETSVFIQNIHHFRDENLRTSNPPIERVAVFDEAQRAWTKEQASRFMKSRKGVPDFDMSEPEFLIQVMDRHDGYAVIVCLIGGGQEINTGEAGLPEWFAALSSRFTNWNVHMPSRLVDFEYGFGKDLSGLISPDRLTVSDDLHLGVSIRSFRAERVSEAVKHLLDLDVPAACSSLSSIKENYPIVITRNLETARQWLRWKARGTERYGIVASSGAQRLKPEGINIKAKIDPVNWFLNTVDDVRSSYYLEDAATEFDVQGLELDWVCVAWDANMYPNELEWVYRQFSGTKWQSKRGETKQRYLKNAYRVLLTRARQGMVIYVPNGDLNDPTRNPQHYQLIADYLLSLRLELI